MGNGSRTGVLRGAGLFIQKSLEGAWDGERKWGGAFLRGRCPTTCRPIACRDGSRIGDPPVSRARLDRQRVSTSRETSLVEIVQKFSSERINQYPFPQGEF